jgi:hypothetical protein
MSSALPSNQSPLWRVLGLSILAAVLGFTAFLSLKRPERLGVRNGSGQGLPLGMQGTYGTITEQLGTGRFDLRYARIEGGTRDLSLHEVVGQLTEPEMGWTLRTPSSHRAKEGVWGLDGPIAIEGRDLQGKVLGKGSVEGQGESLRWERGTWQGLAPLHWESLEGQGKGRWTLPAGWRRDELGRLDAERGPILWEAPEGGTLQSMEARSLHLEKGFLEGRMSGVAAHFADGTVRAAAADFDSARIRWAAPMTFQRVDGWKGEAAGGVAPRPVPGSTIQELEFKDFKAQRDTPGGSERLNANGARWTPAGLRLEGAVQWEQPLEGQTLRLRAPRVLMREAPGEDLPRDLPAGSGRAEGLAVLTWGKRSLTSPTMEVKRSGRAWKIQAPVLGRSEEGSFSAGAGTGSPTAWAFEGPVTVNLTNGGQLRGAALRWEGNEWNMTGRPATWSRLRERLSGRRLVRKGEVILFPEGLNGSLASQDGDLTLRADSGESQPLRVLVEGQVEIRGQGWGLNADRIEVTLAPGRVVRKLSARGRVELRGQIGEGRGESLDLLLEPGSRKASWSGRVRGIAEVKPW